MTRYIYSGPLCCPTLRTKEHPKGMSVKLWPGHAVELPAEHPYVQRLVARGHLARERVSGPTVAKAPGSPNAPEPGTPSDEPPANEPKPQGDEPKRGKKGKA